MAHVEPAGVAVPQRALVGGEDVRVGKLAERVHGAFVNVALAGVVVTWNPDATLNSGALVWIRRVETDA